MKILMVNKFLYPKGGADIYMLKVGEALTKQGHTVEYFGMADKQNTAGNSAGEYTGNMDFHSTGLARFSYPFRIIYSTEAAGKIKKVIQSFQPDIIHMNNINYQLTPSIIEADAAMGIPMVQTVHDFQIICPNHMLFNLKEHAICERCIKGSKWNCAKYSCIHESKVKSIIGSIEANLYKTKDTYRKVNMYICPSRFMEKMLLAGRPDLQGKTCAVHNYIELPAENTISEKAKDGYVVMACRLSMEKGIALVSHAARMLPDIKFKIAGTGPEEDKLKNIPNVELLGYLSGKPLTDLVSRAACMIVPSIWYENCPLTILEAHSLGTPVITAGFGGMAELVEDGITGRLVNPLNADTLAAAIKNTMADRQSLEAMSKSCLAKRSEMITMDKYTAKLENIYRNILSKETK